MEDKVRPVTLSAQQRRWLVSPLFDLLLIANVAWPLLLLPGLSNGQDTIVDFWQVYFLTLPHRWITIGLVMVDVDRRGQRAGWMITLALLIGALVLTSYWSHTWGVSAFVCLGFVDYVWNGWHFGSQHAGVLRIYSRKVGDSVPWLERWGLRLFVFLTILRTSSALLWPQASRALGHALNYADWLILGLAACVLIVALTYIQRSQLSKIIYLLSVTLLYGSYLMASHYHWRGGILCLATAAALFHAVEYLAIVTHYALRRKDWGSPGAMRWLAQRWTVTLTCFVLTLGILGVYLTGTTGGISTFWQGINLWAALIHYSFDGMIWKLRQAATAQSLGVA